MTKREKHDSFFLEEEGRHNDGRLLLALIKSLPESDKLGQAFFYAYSLLFGEEGDCIHNQRKNRDYKHRNFIARHVLHASQY